MYVSEESGHRIQVFTSDGVWIDTWGTRGREENQFVGNHSLAVDDDNNIYIVDLGNDHYLQHYKFTPVAVAPRSWSAMKQVYRSTP